jgi:hypothetical protein
VRQRTSESAAPPQRPARRDLRAGDVDYRDANKRPEEEKRERSEDERLPGAVRLLPGWVVGLLWASLVFDSMVALISPITILAVGDWRAIAYLLVSGPGAILSGLAIRQVRRDGGKKTKLAMAAAIATAFTFVGIFITYPLLFGLTRNPRHPASEGRSVKK